MTKKMGCGQYVGCLFKVIATFIGIVAVLSIAIYAFILSSGGLEVISKTLDGTLPMDSAKWLGHFAIFGGVLASEILVVALIVIATKSKKTRSKEIVFYMLVLIAMIASGILGFFSVAASAERNSYAELLIANTAARYFVLFGVLLLFLREKFLAKKPVASIDHKELVFELLRTLERESGLRRLFVTYMADELALSDDALIERFITKFEQDAELRQRFWVILERGITDEATTLKPDENPDWLTSSTIQEDGSDKEQKIASDPEQAELKKLLADLEGLNKLDEEQKERLDEARSLLDDFSFEEID